MDVRGKLARNMADHLWLARILPRIRLLQAKGPSGTGYCRPTPCPWRVQHEDQYGRLQATAGIWHYGPGTAVGVVGAGWRCRRRSGWSVCSDCRECRRRSKLESEISTRESEYQVSEGRLRKDGRALAVEVCIVQDVFAFKIPRLWKGWMSSL